MTDAQFPAAPAPQAPEDVPRGTIFALAIVPVGILVWVLVWSLGFIASIIAFGIAIGAMFLYRLGAGRMGRTGAIRVALITIATLVLALVAGFAWDLASAIARVNDNSPFDALNFPNFWPTVFEVMFSDGLLSTLIALGFGALGCFSVLRAGFAEATQADAGPADPLAAGGPQTPDAEAAPAAEPAVADSGEEPTPSA